MTTLWGYNYTLKNILHCQTSHLTNFQNSEQESLVNKDPKIV